MAVDLIPDPIRTNYEIREWKHACAVLKGDFKVEWREIIDVLSRFRLRASDVRAPGGGLSPVSQWFDREFKRYGWRRKSFETKIVVDSKEFDSPTHEVDCFKNCVALEVEWNNKDPFFDRDLNNFRLLFDLRAISAGIIITKADELSEMLRGMGEGIWNKYGWSTTWMKKLLPRIEGGGGGGCPILVFGITQRLYDENK